MFRKTHIALVATQLVTTACTADDEPDDAPRATVTGRGGARIEPLAVVETAEGVALEFFATGDSSIVISETAEIGVASPLVYFVAEHDASPLEIYLAVAEAGEDDALAEAPRPLVRDHWDTRAEEPRRLAGGSESFRNYYQSNQAATCTIASDGAWFDSLWMGWGWTWHWYWAGYMDCAGFGSIPGCRKDAPTAVNAQYYFTHLCNYSVVQADPTPIGWLEHYVQQGDGVIAQLVNVGYRHTVYFAESYPTFEFDAQALAGNATGYYKLGATKH